MVISTRKRRKIVGGNKKLTCYKGSHIFLNCMKACHMNSSLNIGNQLEKKMLT